MPNQSSAFRERRESEVATDSRFKICILLDMDMIMQSTVHNMSREGREVGTEALLLSFGLMS